MSFAVPRGPRATTTSRAAIVAMAAIRPMAANAAVVSPQPAPHQGPARASGRNSAP
jgi:hypothetical protein